MAWSEWKKFSDGYENVMYVSNAGNNVSVTASLTVPENVSSGMLMFISSYYTDIDKNSTVSIPSGVEYETLMEKQIIEATGYSTNAMEVQIIKADNIAGKTFSITTNAGYNRGFVWLFY